MQQDSSEHTGGQVPAQRTEAEVPAAAPPAQRAVDETVVLPAFVTGKKEREPKAPEPVRHQAPSDALPASERGMLIFVAALLGAGTIAVVTVLGLGGFSGAPIPRPSSTAAAAVDPPSPSASPSPSPSPSLSPPAPPPPPPSPRTSPARVALGTLTSTDPAAFCTSSRAGRARQRDDSTWFCTGSSQHPPFAFQPTDVCRWRYLDKTAYAVAGDPDDPATWKCFT